MSKGAAVATLLAALVLLGCTGQPEEVIEQGLLKAHHLYEEGHFSEAGAEWRKVLRLSERPSVSDDDAKARSLTGLGRVELAIGSALIAERFFEQSIALMESNGANATLNYGQAQGGLAESYERQGRTRDAIVLARNSLDTQLTQLGSGNGEALAKAQHLLARLLQQSSDFVNNPTVQREATLLYSQVLSYQRQVLGDDSPDILPYVQELQGFLVDLKDSPEVRDIRAEAESIMQRAAARSKQRSK